MQAHLLIDGYNVILGLPHLKKIFPRNKERSRDELEQIACSVYDAEAPVAIAFEGSVMEGARSARPQSDDMCAFSEKPGCLLL